MIEPDIKSSDIIEKSICVITEIILEIISTVLQLDLLVTGTIIKAEIA